MVRVAPVAGPWSCGDAPVRDGGGAAQTARGRTQGGPGTARSGFRRIVRSRGSCHLRSRRPRLPSNGACGGAWKELRHPRVSGVPPESGTQSAATWVGASGCNRFLPSRPVLLCKATVNLFLLTVTVRRGA